MKGARSLCFLSLLALLFVCVSSQYTNGNRGFQKLNIPRSVVSSTVSGGTASGTHNRFDYSIRTCGKTPVWFASDVAQCVDGYSNNPDNDCWDLAVYQPYRYCYDDFNDFQGPITTTVSGYCVNAKSHNNRIGSYDSYCSFDGSCDASCSTNYCPNQETGYARIVIPNGLRSTLRDSDTRGGFVVEMDISYGFAKSGTDLSNPGYFTNFAIQVDAFIQEGGVTTFNSPAVKVSASGLPNFGSSGETPVDMVYPDPDTDALYKSTCRTLTFNFDYSMVPGSTYGMVFDFYNAINAAGTAYYFDSTNIFGGEIAVSDIRIYEKAGTNDICTYYETTLQSVNFASDSIQRENSYLLENLYESFNSDATPLTCDLCPNSLNNGNAICTADGPVTNGFSPSNRGPNYFTSLRISTANLAGSGVKATGGYLILYGTQFDSNVEITVYGRAAGRTFLLISEKKPVVTTSPVNGIYYFCGNCQYMVWNFDSIEGFAFGSDNFLDIYVSEDEQLCIAGYNAEFITTDVQGPFFQCRTTQVTYTLSPGSGASRTLSAAGNVADYYTANQATDNCDTYLQNGNAQSDIIPYSLSITYIDVWDYEYDSAQYPSQVFTATDRSGNSGSCSTQLAISLNPAMIQYPTNNNVISITNIIVRWANYAPIIDGRASVKITLVPTGACASRASVVLGENINYLTFSYFYRGPTKNIDTTTCLYDMYFVITQATPQKDVTFVTTGLSFIDLKN